MDIFTKFFLKRIFSRISTWIILILHLLVVGLLFFSVREKGTWPFGRKEIKEEIIIDKESDKPKGVGKSEWKAEPKINNTNDFFACVFPNLIFLPLFLWTFIFHSLAWLWWKQFEDIGSETQKDGTDLFFLSTEIPTSRKRIFRRKIFFLTSILVGLHLILFSLPLSLLMWKANYFSNFTGLQIFLFLAMNFVFIPLFLLVPLIIFLFSLASCNSVWYYILAWFGRFSTFLIGGFYFFILGVIRRENGKLPEWWQNFSKWLGQHYLLTTLTIMGAVIFLVLFTLPMAYKDFQKKYLQ